MKYLAWLWQNTRGVRFNIAVRIVVGLAQVSLGLLMVWFSKHFIDVTIKTGSESDIVQMVGLLALTIVGGVVLRQVCQYMMASANVKKTNELRLRLFSGMFMRRLYDDKVLLSGDVTSRLSKDIDAVGEVVAATIPQIAVTFCQLVGAFLLMRWFDARLAWALVLVTPVAIVAGKFIAHKLRHMTLRIREGESRIQMHVQEGVEHNAVLRSLESERWMTDQLETMQRDLRGNVLRRMRFTTVTRFVLGCTFGLGYLMAFVWGGIGLRNGAITFGVMTSFLQLVGQIQQPILSILNMAPQVVHATASIDRLEELGSNLEETEAVVGPQNVGSQNVGSQNVGPQNVGSQNVGSPTALKTSVPSSAAPSSAASGIRFENVSFRYAKGDREILTNFTHEFKPGTKTALVGETGAGKSTLFRMMLGFIEPTAGSVSRLPRADFVFVPQGNTLLSGSVRYNLLLAKPEATEEELWAVLHTACADFVRDLPQGLDSELGERGCGLSEGQAERIAVARGLLRPGSIMLLDEISAALDEATEREMYQRLFKAYPQKTMIFITHRPAVCDLCDEIVKL